eukprot:4177474-Pleurochrysis_carterae.AAC.1
MGRAVWHTGGWPQAAQWRAPAAASAPDAGRGRRGGNADTGGRQARLARDVSDGHEHGGSARNDGDDRGA